MSDMTFKKAMQIKRLAQRCANLKEFQKEAKELFPEDYDKPHSFGLLRNSWQLLKESQIVAGWKCSYARYKPELVITRKIARQIHYIRIHENRGNFTGIARRLRELHPFHTINQNSQELISDANEILQLVIVNNSELYYRDRLEPVLDLEMARFIVYRCPNMSSRKLSEVLTDRYPKYDFGDGMQVGHYYRRDAYAMLNIPDPDSED